MYSNLLQVIITGTRWNKGFLDVHDNGACLKPTAENKKRSRTFQDALIGMSIFGSTGILIGVYLDSWIVAIGGGIAGSVLGIFVGKLGARRFFLCVLIGTIAGGFLGWYAGGVEVIRLGAGTGSAIGGFIGINIELFKRPQEHKDGSFG